MTCSGICEKFKAKKPATRSWYVSNNRCRSCEIFIEGKVKVYCPCCGYNLRSRPRNKKYKAKLKAQVT